MALLAAAPRSAASETWGPWATITSHNGVDFRVCCESTETDGKYMWRVQFRSRYTEDVGFDFRITRPGDRPRSFSGRVVIKPGRTEEGWNMVAVRPGGTVDVWTKNWKFGRDAE